MLALLFLPVSVRPFSSSWNSWQYSQKVVDPASKADLQAGQDSLPPIYCHFFLPCYCSQGKHHALGISSVFLMGQHKGKGRVLEKQPRRLLVAKRGESVRLFFSISRGFFHSKEGCCGQLSPRPCAWSSGTFTHLNDEAWKLIPHSTGSQVSCVKGQCPASLEAALERKAARTQVHSDLDNF